MKIPLIILSISFLISLLGEFLSALTIWSRSLIVKKQDLLIGLVAGFSVVFIIIHYLYGQYT